MMTNMNRPLVIAGLALLSVSCQENLARSVTVPVILDHNRMLVEAELQRNDGTWRAARLWVDTGNPEFFYSEALARDLGFDISAGQGTDEGSVQSLDVPAPAGIRIGGMALDLLDVTSKVMFEPGWLFDAMHNDANLPSTVLQNYQVVFDYPQLELTIAEPGTLEHRGVGTTASVNRTTGIVQIGAIIDGDSLSLALDNGASYSFVADEVFERLSEQKTDWQRGAGAVGCANIWGWWYQESVWPITRLSEIEIGAVPIRSVGIVGLPELFPNGPELGEWYSQKTAHPVDGFLGPNALKAFRVEIDYSNSFVYFEQGTEFDQHDMDLVGLTLRLLPDRTYEVIGIAESGGRPVVEGVEPGDKLLQVGDLNTTAATMGTVVDALRGEPGAVRILVLERNGERITIEAKVTRVL